MRKAILSGAIAGLWLVGCAVGMAQMSTFPSPPPLPPPSAGGNSSGSSTTAAPPSTGNANNPASEGNAPSGMASASSAVPVTSAPAGVTAATLNSMAVLDDKTPLSPGDRISFRVIEDRDDAVPRIVTDTGEVDFPYIGRVKVEGLTCHQVAVKLKQLLEVDYYKRATVIVGLDVIASDQQADFHNVCWVIGQVRQVGPQQLSDARPMTVSQIILRAGGFGDFADQRRIRLIHRGAIADGSANPPAPDADDSKEGQIIDVKAVYEGHMSNDPIVRPNDYIIVPKKIVNF